MRLTTSNIYEGMLIEVRKDCTLSHQEFTGKPGTRHVVFKRNTRDGGGFYIETRPTHSWGLYEHYVQDFDVVANVDAALLLT